MLDGADAVVRTFSSQPAAPLIYASADIATDFPSGLPTPFRFTVYQLSATVGRGVGTKGEVWFA